LLEWLAEVPCAASLTPAPSPTIAAAATMPAMVRRLRDVVVTVSVDISLSLPFLIFRLPLCSASKIKSE
jgi:hypothetical protein